MEGLGNDYVYVDCTHKTEAEIERIANLTVKLSDRHFGIGSDGLILICKSNVADFKMVMFNKDGSQAEMCGNGIRCVGKFVYDKGLTNKSQITIETLAGIKELKLNIEQEKVKTVTVNMGEPILKPEQIPVFLGESPNSHDSPHMSNTQNSPNCLNNSNNINTIPRVTLNAVDRSFDFTCVSMGNPHAITMVENLDTFDVEKYGKILEIDKHFPQKSNIEFIEKINDSTFKMRVWERGSGETLACGTGACAATVACILNGLAKKKQEITIKLLGGNLNICWDKNVYMTGPATIVFEGEYDG